jgi:hypothetical protein
MLQGFFQLYEDALDACPEARLALFTLPDRRTFASRSIDSVTEHAIDCSKRGLHVYIHIHLHVLPEGAGGRRGSIDTARAAIGLFADIDACGPGRKKPAASLCPTVGDAIAVAARFDSVFQPLETAALIASGHGCYPVVLFKEPLLIATPDDLTYLESMGRRFHYSVQRIAAEYGWTGAVDYCDLAKVLRPPGTINYKDPACPRLVTSLYERPSRFTVIGLDELLPIEPPKHEAQKCTKHVNGENVPDWVREVELILNPQANPPADKFRLLVEVVSDFSPTWNHKRRLKDQSQSGYDLALAYLAVLAEWTDQEIVDLLIANRRLHGGQPKLRRDYFERTLGKAQAARANLDSKGSPAEGESRSSAVPDSDANLGHERTATSDENVTDDAQGYPRTAGPATNDWAEKPPGTGASSHREQGATVSATLEALSRYLGLRIRRVVKYRGDPASSYKIETDNGDVTLDRINDLTGQSRLRNRIADVTGHLIPLFEPEDWHPIVRMLLDAHDLDDLGADATQHGITGGWIREYLLEKRVNDAPEDADSAREPFVKDEAVCIYLENLRSWLQLRYGQKLEPRRLATYLRQYGAAHIPKLDVEINGKRTSRGVWKLPAGTWPSD